MNHPETVFHTPDISFHKEEKKPETDFHNPSKNPLIGLITLVLNHSPTFENIPLISSQCSLTKTVIVATDATIAPTRAAIAIPMPSIGAKIITPIVVIATPTTINASFNQLNPFLSICTKLYIAVNAPVTTETIPPIADATDDIVEAEPPNTLARASLKFIPLNSPSITSPILVTNPEIPRLIAPKSAAPIEVPFSAPSAETIALTIPPLINNPSLLKIPAPNITFPIFLIVTAPMIIATVSASKLLKNSFAPFQISFQEILLNAVVTVSNAPCAHELSVLANNAKSKFWKNLFIPSAIEFPNCFQLNVVPNESNP